MTDRYVLIGNPVSHSKSPLIHNGFARQAKQDLSYATLEAPPGGFKAAADAFRAAGGRGMNVTTPFKLDAFAYATDPSPVARLAGAVNCLKFEGERVFAENFDGAGLLIDLQRNLGFAVRERRVLVLGAGGAARGALEPLLGQQPEALVIANRTHAKAAELAKQFARLGRVAGASYAELAGQRFDIVLNCTSASQYGELLPLPRGVYAPGALAYDMVYDKGLTPFLRHAREAGAARLADGIGMLVEQAAEAFAWWRGVRPETRAMIDAVAVPLA